MFAEPHTVTRMAGRGPVMEAPSRGTRNIPNGCSHQNCKRHCSRITEPEPVEQKRPVRGEQPFADHHAYSLCEDRSDYKFMDHYVLPDTVRRSLSALSIRIG
jgi:hypothetical protein